KIALQAREIDHFGILRIESVERVWKLDRICVERPAVRWPSIDVSGSGTIECAIPKPRSDCAKTLDEAGHELSTVVIEVHGEAGRGGFAEAGCCLARFDGEPAAKIALQRCQVHAARRRFSRAIARATSISASSSGSGGMPSSRSIIVATGPTRSSADAESDQTGSGTGLSWVSISSSRPWLWPARWIWRTRAAGIPHR